MSATTAAQVVREHGDGAGKVLAEWVTEGETEWDMWSCDPRRYTSFAADKDYCVAKGMEIYGHEYAMHFPKHAWPAGRDQKLSPIHDRIKALGAQFKPYNGWERANWYAKPGDELRFKVPCVFDVESGKATVRLTDAGGQAWLPAIGRHEVLVADARSWQETARVPVKGQPVFVMARPDGRQVWVNFAFPDNEWVQVIDTVEKRVVHTFSPGKAVLHMEFEPRGEEVWLSSRDSNRVSVVNTTTFATRSELPADAPSGIFFTARGQRIGF